VIKKQPLDPNYFTKTFIFDCIYVHGFECTLKLINTQIIDTKSTIDH